MNVLAHSHAKMRAASLNSLFDGKESETNSDALIRDIKVFSIIGMFASNG